MSRGTPLVHVRISTREKNALAQRAADVGLDLSRAMREGARYYLAALEAGRANIDKREEAQAA